MKKIFNLILAALVIIGAAACTKSEEIVDQTQQGEGLSFYANVVNDVTRAYIDDTDGDKTWNTVWEGGEVLVVETANPPYVSYEFTCTDTETGKFVCKDDNATELLGKSVTISNVDAEEYHSRSGNRAYYIWTNIESFSVDQPINLVSQTSFFRYTYNGEGEVTLSLSIQHNNGDVIEAKKAFREPGEGSYSLVEQITFKGKGETIVPFWPGTGSADISTTDATLSYSIKGVKCKETTIKNICWGKVYNLGTLVAIPVESEFGVVGSFQKGTAWDVAKPVKMYTTENAGWVVARGIELYKDDEFKIIKGNSWDVSYGQKDAAKVLAVDVEHSLVAEGGQNIKAAKNGKFDIYFNTTNFKMKYVCVEEYTDLTVNITIDNKANWSPLYIILKSGQTLLTPAEGAPVSDNKYAVSGDYIGSSLSYQFVSGSKKTDFANVTITKKGATVTLEETVIKLRVQLTTDNAKKWWGSKMCIYVWDSGSALDTGWPGTEMTSEGNYTWSINVPSELVGKTIKYIINNGAKWQSGDSTITISAEGNYVDASKIGIN